MPAATPSISLLLIKGAAPCEFEKKTNSNLRGNEAVFLRNMDATSRSLQAVLFSLVMLKWISKLLKAHRLVPVVEVVFYVSTSVHLRVHVCDFTKGFTLVKTSPRL